MTRYLIDTDYAVDVLNARQAAIQTLLQLSPQGLAISLITYGELYEGAYYARDARAALGALAAFVESMEILPLTVPIMQRFAVLRGSLSRPTRQQVGDMDLLIAATAIDHGLTLVTRNLKDFRLVPGLALFEST